MARKINEYLLYRWRYHIGYSTIALILGGLLTLAWLHIPGGLSSDEMGSVVTSSGIVAALQSLTPETILNLPYHLLQHASLAIFGVSTLSIKLPSFLLALLSSVGVLLLLRKWFRQNVAVITTVLIITTGQFLFLAQNGTPAIMYVFWPVWILVSALMVSRHARLRTLWKVVLFASAGLSLYTPFGIYVLLALFGATLLHPHLRYLLRQISKAKLSLGVLGMIILTIPLNYAVILQPAVGLELLGIPSTWPDLLANGRLLLHQYFDFMSPGGNTMMTPIYGLGSTLLVILGLIRLLDLKHTARGYIIIAWIVLLIPLLTVNPRYISVTFVPIILLMATGVNLLLTRWYDLFPRNPYARIAGLFPLAILLGGMMVSGVDRFMYGYLYEPRIASSFTKDLDYINAQLDDPNRGATAISVGTSQKAFYSVVAKDRSNAVVSEAAPASGWTTLIAARDTRPSKATPWRIVTSPTSTDADRFYIYKSAAK